MLRLRLSNALDQVMTEIRFTDGEPDQTPHLSRIFVLGNRMRMDFGRDDQGFILFDRAVGTIWHVSPTDRRITGVVPAKAPNLWPARWVLSQDEMPSEQSVLRQIRVNDVLCAEFKTSSTLQYEASMLADFRRALKVKQAKFWQGMAEDERHPCMLAVDVHAAGVEYDRGLPLAIRYWDGRTRIFQGHERLAPRPELFALPGGYVQTLNREASVKEIR